MWGKAIYPVHTYHSLPSATGSDARNQEQEEGGVMPACSSPTLFTRRPEHCLGYS